MQRVVPSGAAGVAVPGTGLGLRDHRVAVFLVSSIWASACAGQCLRERSGRKYHYIYSKSNLRSIDHIGDAFYILMQLIQQYVYKNILLRNIFYRWNFL